LKRSTVVLASLAVTVSLLSGCSGDEDSKYCDDLASAEENFRSLETADFSNFGEFAEQVEGLAKDAPSEVKDDWKVISDSFNSFIDALEELGLEPQDLGKELPPGVDPNAFTEAMAIARTWSEAAFTDASEAIDKHAKDECNFEFTGG
jgi:hypothetical protein